VATHSHSNSEYNKLEKLRNVTDELKIPYNYYTGKWLGVWQTVKVFSGTGNVTTETFRISSPYHLWRINFTFSGSEDACFGFDVYTVSKPQFLVKCIGASYRASL